MERHPEWKWLDSGGYSPAWKLANGYYTNDGTLLTDAECDVWDSWEREHRESAPTRHQLRRLFGIKTATSAGGRRGPDKEEVRERCDMVLLYERLTGIEVRRRSGRYIQARCYAHGEDKSASLSLDTKLKRYNCFACGEKGDCYKLWTEHNGGTFPDAVRGVEGIAC